jgi:hypothetical protein
MYRYWEIEYCLLSAIYRKIRLVTVWGRARETDHDQVAQHAECNWIYAAASSAHIVETDGMLIEAVYPQYAPDQFVP